MRILLGIHVSDRWKSLFSAYLPYVHFGIVLLLGITSYANSLDVPLQFDDPTVVRSSFFDSNDLYSLQGFISKARWFADLTFQLNRFLHGEQVLGYHLINLAIHLSAAWVIYLFVLRTIEAMKQTFQLSGDDGQTAFLNRFIPFASAAVFVCHPIQTQAVTYIAQRYTSLATLLYVSSLLSYLMARLSYTDETRKLYVWSWGCACFLFAVLAMKSKEIAFTLPLMALLLEVVLFRGQLLKNRIYLALGAGLLLLIPLQLIYMRGTKGTGNFLQHIQSAATETALISRTDYLLTQFRVIATYLRLMVLPINQNLDYDYPVYHSLFDPSVCAALLLHVSLIVSALFLLIRSRRYLSSETPAVGIAMRLASLGIFWFYLALSVESSIVPISDVIFEHRVYLPSTGFFICAAAGTAGIAIHWQWCRMALWAMIILVCCTLTAGTIARNRIWASELTLWQDVLEKSPNKARVRHAVGFLYFSHFQPDKALPHLVRAVEIEPNTVKYWISLNSQISIIDMFKGRCSEGLEYHTSADIVEPKLRKPWTANSYNNLGLAYEYLGNIYLAQENFQKAVIRNPSLDLAWYNLALVAARRNDTATANNAREKLRALNPQLENHLPHSIK